MTLKKTVAEFLDSLRGLASLLVVFAHANQFFILPLYGTDGPQRLIPGYFASCAVIAFFVLSGFVISMSICNSISRNKKAWFIDFMIRRIARIYPPFIFSLILTIFICSLIYFFILHSHNSLRISGDMYVVRESISFQWASLPQILMMLPGFIKVLPSYLMNGPLWSLSYEFWMYIIAGLFAYGVLQKRLLARFLLVFILGFQIITRNDLFIYLALIWSLGALCFFLTKLTLTASMKKYISILAYICLLIMGTLIIFRRHSIVIPYKDIYSYTYQYALTVFILCIICYFKLWELSIIRFFKFTASYSYTLYVIHFPIFLLFFSVFHSTFMRSDFFIKLFIFSGAIIFSVCVSHIVAPYIENSLYFYEKINLLRIGLLARTKSILSRAAVLFF